MGVAGRPCPTVYLPHLHHGQDTCLFSWSYSRLPGHPRDTIVRIK